MTKSQVTDVLSGIQDPDSGAPFLESNIIHQLEIIDSRIQLTLALRDPQAAFKSPLNFEIQSRLQQAFPDAEVDVHFHALPSQEKNTRILPHVKNIIAVASGKGGAGKSTMSYQIACELDRRGFKTGLLDADLYGPSIPLLAGLQGQRPKVVKYMGMNKLTPLDAQGIEVMSIGFVIDAEQAVVMRGPRLSGVIKQFIHETFWSSLDYLIVDLPPGTGDIHLTMVQTIPITGALMVTTPSELSVADAIKAMNMFRLPNVQVPLLGVIENMSWFTPADQPNKTYQIFGNGGGKQLAIKGDTKLLHQMPLFKSLSAEEVPVVEEWKQNHTKTMVDALLERIEWRHQNVSKTKVVQMNS